MPKRVDEYLIPFSGIWIGTLPWRPQADANRRSAYPSAKSAAGKSGTLLGYRRFQDVMQAFGFYDTQALSAFPHRAHDGARSIIQ
jgi:hypothetical protein